MAPKYFTPQEANKRLPYVKKIVAEIIGKGQRIRALLTLSAGHEIPAECETLQEEMESLLQELEQLGCFYKDWNFEIGLVDFPALIEGEEVLLCWKSDEPEITWYHRLGDGFIGRRPIPQRLLTSK